MKAEGLPSPDPPSVEATAANSVPSRRSAKHPPVGIDWLQ
jgi:hypothetical protein